VVLLSYHLTPKDRCSRADHGCGDALSSCDPVANNNPSSPQSSWLPLATPSPSRAAVLRTANCCFTPPMAWGFHFGSSMGSTRLTPLLQTSSPSQMAGASHPTPGQYHGPLVPCHHCHIMHMGRWGAHRLASALVLSNPTCTFYASLWLCIFMAQTTGSPYQSHPFLGLSFPSSPCSLRCSTLVKLFSPRRCFSKKWRKARMVIPMNNNHLLEFPWGPGLPMGPRGREVREDSAPLREDPGSSWVAIAAA